MNRILGCVVLLLAGAIAGCMDGDDERGTSGLPPESRVDALHADQKETLCDWADRLAPEGRTVDCGAGHTTTRRANAEECRKDFLTVSNCPVTVRQIELCFISISDDPCVLIPDACLALTECK